MFQPIDSYGVIGDLHTVALVGKHGSIDWLCFPRFDSPTVCAALLDDQKGGRFSIAPESAAENTTQLYWPETNVLVTRYLSAEGAGEVIDYMPVGTTDSGDGHHQIIRSVRAVRGQMRFVMACTPAFDYARAPHETTLCEHGASFHSADLSLGLSTDVPLERLDGGVRGGFTLDEGKSAVFLLRQIEPDADCGPCFSPEEAHDLFTCTVRYWQDWIGGCSYTGRWRETVHRSVLALKLLTYAPTGAIVAAPTFGLPEVIGGERNWDYRYTWLRDAAFTLYALMRVGLHQEAAQFVAWLDARCHEPESDGSLQVMYGIDGRHDLPETTLDHLEGYRGSRPVRIGNAACDQLQLDIYGELMDAVYLYNKYGAPISSEMWTHLRDLTEWLCENWRRADEGIWETRGGRKQFVTSKLMCWVALDRALRLADKRSFPAPRDRWLAIRDEIYEEVMARGWNAELASFVQSYDDDNLDASTLLMPLVLFLAPTDPRLHSMLDAIYRSPRDGGLSADGLVYRYNIAEGDDGLEGQEGTFSTCTFWLVEGLTRAGRVDEARFMFERMLGYANHLGLYSEEIGPAGELLGNYPQALTHLALISAAFNLDRALGKH
ncbi:MAG: glycoside hydrolase family 15 protein [Chloroflexia bacterium]|nr:glycoside hydrolase family 15 protein [Chloroflexia bacterium]